MKESTLAQVLSGATDAAALRADLADVIGTDTLRTGDNMIPDLPRETVITGEHLILLCDMFLAGDLTAEHLRAIAFFLLASDHFTWDTEIGDGAVIADVIADWSAPEINFALTKENVARYRVGLREGRYAFAREITR